MGVKSLFENMISLMSTVDSLRVESITDDQWGIEGIYSQQFSVGIFIFLIICIIVFTFIVFKFMGSGTNKDGTKSGLKTGEKIMFFWIFLGIIGAVVMAAVQLLQGYLL